MRQLISRWDVSVPKADLHELALSFHCGQRTCFYLSKDSQSYSGSSRPFYFWYKFCLLAFLWIFSCLTWVRELLSDGMNNEAVLDIREVQVSLQGKEPTILYTDRCPVSIVPVLNFSLGNCSCILLLTALFRCIQFF